MFFCKTRKSINDKIKFVYYPIDLFLENVDDQELNASFDNLYLINPRRADWLDREGEAITLVNQKDWPYLLKIEKLIEAEIDKPELPAGCGEKPVMHCNERRRPNHRYKNPKSAKKKRDKVKK